MIFSHATSYAIRALAVLPEDGTYRLARDLAATLDLPGPYLAKTLQVLVQAGLLESIRGPRGGFRLARPAGEIKVGDIHLALEGTEAMSECLLGFTNCGSETPCPLHDTWTFLKEGLATRLTQVSLADLKKMGRTPGPVPCVPTPRP